MSITKLIDDIKNLSTTPNAQQFITHYADIKERIDETDIILNDISQNQSSLTNSSTNINTPTNSIYNELSIEELFEIVNDNESFFENMSTIDASKLVDLTQLIDTLESKLRSSTFEILEHK